MRRSFASFALPFLMVAAVGRHAFPAAAAEGQTPPRLDDVGASEEPDDEPDDEASEGAEVAAAGVAEDSTPLTFRGYVDVGYARAEGNGTSFSPHDTRLPADYRVDPFAPAVNTFGDVASTDSEGRFVNGFLPTTTGQGGKGSFLLNVLSLDTRYEPKASPITAFARVQLFPRYIDGRDASRVWVEQAFGRLQPFAGQEFTITVGKFDSVFGIEYLENQSNFRVGVTPSLFARYTTGRSVGVKSFYRLQIPSLWSAVSLNVSATNSGTFVEALAPTSRSLTGTPVFAARFGYELNLPFVGMKFGTSGMHGPRNDQEDPNAEQRMYGFDARLFLFGLTLSGEYVNVKEGLGGPGGKFTGLGQYPLASGFWARGFYGQAAYGLRLDLGPLRRITAYARYERRSAEFEGFGALTVDRITGGLRFEFWESLLVKVEALRNRERAGAPKVGNDVVTSSVVFSW